MSGQGRGAGRDRAVPGSKGYGSCERMKKVLVIDDTPEIPMIIAESLNLYGFTTLAAGDGVTGIQIARGFTSWL